MPAATLEPPAKPAAAPAAAPKVILPPSTAKAPPAAPKKLDEPTPPPATPAANPPGTSDEPIIDTQIVPLKGKSAEQYAEERRKSKEDKVAAKLGLPELEKERDEFRTKATTYEQELTKERSERALEKARLAEVEARQKELNEEVEASRSRYFDEYKVDFDARGDQELQTAHQTFRGTLISKMPNRITGSDGEQRVFIDQVLSDPKKAVALDKAMDFYAKAEAAHDPMGMDRAVNYAAQVLGAPVKFSERPEDEVLLESSNAEFRQIEEAMRAGLPSFASRQSRAAFVRDQAPQLVQQQIQQREDSIKTSLRSAIFLTPDARASLAAVNPMDSGVIIGDILQHSPDLAEMLNGWIAVNGPAFARMGKIQMPTLASNDPAAIAAHRAESQRHQGALSESMRLAAIGKVAGHIITALMGEVHALRERAGDVSSNNNPGTTRSGEGGVTTEADPVIDTQIVKPTKR